MYNNFLSKKSKKAISALLASALVITAAPINAEAATTKTLGVGKSFTVTAASAKSKITGLSAAEKKIVSVTRKNSKSKVYTIKAKTAGKVTFKIGAKTVKVNAGATKIFRNGSSKVTVTAGKYTNLDVRTAYGKGDTLTFTSSNSKVASIVKGKTTAKVKYNKSNSITKNTKALKAVKAGKATITIKSKNTGKSYKLYVTVKAATPKATATPVVTTNAPATPVVTETAPATTTAAAVTETPVATATAPAVTASAPAVTSTPVPTTGATITNTPAPTTGAAVTSGPATTETPAPTTGAAVTSGPVITETPAPTPVTGGTITVTGAAVSGATIVVTNASGAAVNIKDRLPAGTYTVTVSKEGYVTASKEVTIADKDAKVVEFDLEENLKVASVEALNLAEIQVTFNKKLTGDALTNAQKSVYYSVYKDGSSSASSVARVTVSEDQTSVILLLGDNDILEHGKNANKVVVKKAIGFDADYTAENVESKDVDIPQVVAAKAIGNKTFQITFSEAIKGTNITVDGAVSNTVLTNGVFTITSDTGVAATKFESELSYDHRTVTITTDNVLTAGTYKIAVKDGAITDYAKYPVPAATQNVTIDTVTKVAAPKKVTVNSRTMVTVEFDGVVKDSATAKLTWKSGTTSKSKTGAYASKDNTKLYFYFAAEDVMPVGEVDFTLESVQDAYGYDVPTTTFEKQTVKADSIATATTKVINDGKIEIIFSKAMKGTADTSNSTTAGDVNNKANYSIVNTATGEAEDLTTVNAEYVEELQTDNTYIYKVVLSKSGWALKGDYTITVSGAKDAIGTEMTKMVETVNVKDTTRPTVVKTNGAYEAKLSTSGKISVTFSEDMATSGDYSITNAKSYTLNGTNLSDMTGVVLTAADAKTVIITLPDTYKGAKTSLTIGSVGTSINTVADEAGNILDGDGNGSITATVNVVGEVPPTIASSVLKVGGAHNLLVAVSNLSKVSVSDFLYTVDGSTWNTPEAAELKTIDGTTYISLTIADTLSAATKREKVKVKAKTVTGSAKLGSESALGSSLVAGGQTAEIGTKLSAWPFQTALKSAETLNTTQIRVEFDGLIGDVSSQAGKDSLAEFLTVSNNGVEKKIASVVADGDNAVIINIKTTESDTALDTEKSIVVKTVPYASNTTVGNWAVDGNKVYYSENTTGVNAPVTNELKVMTVVLDNVNGKLSVSGDSETSFKVTFNAPIAGEDKTGLNAKIDSTGKLTVEGYDFGEITGITAVKPCDDLKASVTMSDGNRTMTLKLTADTDGLLDAFINGKVSYTPSAKITSASNTNKKVTVAVKESASNSLTSSVEVAAQDKVLEAKKANSVKFDVTTEFIANATVPTVKFVANNGDDLTTAPTGLKAQITNVANNKATVTVSATDEAVAGKYYFVVTAAGKTSDVTTVDVTEPKINSVGEQTGTITEGSVGSATFGVTSENVNDGIKADVSFVDENGKAISPEGLSVAAGAVETNSSTVTVTATTSAKKGEYKLKISFGSVSKTATVTVSQ